MSSVIAEERMQIMCMNVLRAEEKQRGDLIAFHVANERKTTPRRGARLKALGVRAGVCDIIILMNGGAVLFIELKTKKGSQSKSQKAFEQSVTDLGFQYHLIKEESPYHAVRRLSTILSHARAAYTRSKGE